MFYYLVISSTVMNLGGNSESLKLDHIKINLFSIQMLLKLAI